MSAFLLSTILVPFGSSASLEGVDEMVIPAAIEVPSMDVAAPAAPEFRDEPSFSEVSSSLVPAFFDASSASQQSESTSSEGMVTDASASASEAFSASSAQASALSESSSFSASLQSSYFDPSYPSQSSDASLSSSSESSTDSSASPSQEEVSAPTPVTADQELEIGSSSSSSEEASERSDPNDVWVLVQGKNPPVATNVEVQNLLREVDAQKSRQTPSFSIAKIIDIATGIQSSDETVPSGVRGELMQKVNTLKRVNQDERNTLIAGIAGELRRSVSSIRPDASASMDLVLNAARIRVPKDRIGELAAKGYNITELDIVKMELSQSVPQIGANAVWTKKADGGNCTVGSPSCITGKGVKIAIIDTGIDYTHADFGSCASLSNCPKIAGGYDFVNSDTDPIDDSGHGTHVAGIAAGNGVLKGVAPDATLYAYKVLGANGVGDSGAVAAAIDRSIDPDGNGDLTDRVDVINLSLGSLTKHSPDDVESLALDRAVTLGVVGIVGVGNNGPGALIYSPANARLGIAVGAVNKSGVLADFSTYGKTSLHTPKPDIVAPGVDICAAKAAGQYTGVQTCIDSNHVVLPGTSMAAPHVAGVAALMRQAHPTWTPQQVKATLRATASANNGAFDLLAFASQGHGLVQSTLATFSTVLDPVTLSTAGGVGGIIDIKGTISPSTTTSYSLSIQSFKTGIKTELLNTTASPNGNTLLAGFDTNMLSIGDKYYLLLETITTARVKSRDVSIIYSNNEVPLPADLKLTVVGDAAWLPTGTGTYVMTVKNLNASVTASSIFVTANLDTYSEFLPALSSPECVKTGVHHVVCSLSSLAPNASKQFTVKFAAQDSKVTCDPTITNTANAWANNYDLDTSNNENIKTNTTFRCPADLSLSRVGSGAITRGNNGGFKLTVANAGPGNTTSVTVTDTPPTADSIFQPSLSSTECRVSGNVVVCNGFGVNAGVSKALTVVYKVPTITNCSPQSAETSAAATSTTFDWFTSNNTTPPLATAINCPAGNAADLSVTATGSTAGVLGSNFSVAASVLNKGPQSASATIFTLALPANATLVSTSDATCSLANGVVTCPAVTLASNQTKSLFLQLKLPLNGTCPVVATSLASATTTTTDPVAGNNSASLLTSISCPPADLSLMRTGSASIVRGSAGAFSVTVLNNGPGTASNVSLEDNLPADFVFQPSDGCQFSGNKVICDGFSLASGFSKTFTINYSVPIIVNCSPKNVTSFAKVSATTTDTNLVNNTTSNFTTSITCPPPSADLVVTATGATTAVAGSTFSALVAVRNAGPSTASSVVLKNKLPTGAVFISSSDPNCINIAGTITCGSVSLPVNQTKATTIQMRMPLNAACPVALLNTATATTATTDFNTANNTANLSTDLNCPPADLALTRTGSASIVRGSNGAFILTVTNNGPADATDVSVNDFIPSDFTFQASAGCRMSGLIAVCDGFNLAAGVSKTFTINYFAPVVANCSPKNVTSYGTVTAATNDANTTNNTTAPITTVITCPVALADIVVTATGATTAVSGNTFSTIVAVKNNGPQTANAVVLSSQLPAGALFVSSSDAACTNIAGTVRCAATNLLANQSKTVTIQMQMPVNATCPATLVNTASATTATTDPTLSNNSATLSTALACPPADLSITRTGSASILRGSKGAFRVTVTNNGPGEASAVSVTDNPPTDFVFLPSVGCQLLSAKVLCDGFNLAAGATKTFTINYSVPATTTCNSKNVTSFANVAAATVDPNVTNNATAPLGTSIPCPQADLAVTATGASAVVVGGNFSFTGSIINKGPQAAENTVLTIHLPSGTTLLSVTDAACTASASVLTCLPTTLAVNQVKKVGVKLGTNPTMTCPVAIATIVSASSMTNDPVSGNNAANLITSATCAPADVQVTRTATGAVRRGDTMTVTLTVTNKGPGPANGVMVTDMLGAGFAFVSGNSCTASGQTVICTTGSLSSAASSTHTIMYRISSSLPCVQQTVQSSAKVVALSYDPNLTNNIAGPMALAILCPQADLSISTPGPASALVGDTFYATYVVKNNGPVAADGVVFSGEIPVGSTFVGSPPAGCTLVNRKVQCSLGGLALNQTKTVTYPYTFPVGVACPVSLDTMATVSSTTNDLFVANNSANQKSNVACPLADVFVGVNTSPTAVVDGVFSVTFAAKNIGPSVAQNVVLSNLLPENSAFVGSSDASCTYDASTRKVTCAGVHLAKDEVKRVTMQLKMLAGSLCPTDVGNTVSATSTTADPNMSNNTVMGSTGITCPVTDLQASISGMTAGKAEETFTTTLTAKNNGEANAYGVVMGAQLPTGAVLLGISDPTCQLSGQAVSCAPTALPANQEKTVYMNFKMPAGSSCPASLKTVATVSSGLVNDPVDNNWSILWSTLNCPPAPPNLAAVSSGPTSIGKNKPGVYKFGAVNTSPANATPTAPSKLVVVLPTNTVFTSKGSSPLCSLASKTSIYCNVPSMNSGQSVLFPVVLTRKTAGKVTFTGVVVPGGVDANPSDNQSVIATTIK